MSTRGGHGILREMRTNGGKELVKTIEIDLPEEVFLALKETPE